MNKPDEGWTWGEARAERLTNPVSDNFVSTSGNSWEDRMAVNTSETTSRPFCSVTQVRNASFPSLGKQVHSLVRLKIYNHENAGGVLHVGRVRCFGMYFNFFIQFLCSARACCIVSLVRAVVR